MVVVSIVCVTVSLLAFCATVGFALLAPKLDPYQSQQVRHNAIKLVVQQEVAYCIAFPVLFAALLTIKFFQPVMVSLFMQGIALASLWSSYSYRVGTGGSGPAEVIVSGDGSHKLRCLRIRLTTSPSSTRAIIGIPVIA